MDRIILAVQPPRPSIPAKPVHVPSRLIAPASGRIGGVFLAENKNISEEALEMAQQIFQRHNFIGRVLDNLGITGTVREISVKYLDCKKKRLFFATAILENGDAREIIFTVQKGQNLAGQIETICNSDPAHGHTHRFGGREIIRTPITTFEAYAINSHPGVPLSDIVGTIERLTGVPGWENKSIGQVKIEVLQSALEELTKFSVITAEERDAIISSAAKSNNDVAALAAFTTKLRNLILTLDTEAIQAQFAFFHTTGFVQTDPRRDNIIFRINEGGERTYTPIDYDSMGRDSLGYQIAMFDVFTDHGNIFDSARPWCWTYQRNAATRFSLFRFFEAIWKTVPEDQRSATFRKAINDIRNSYPRLAVQILKFLSIKGE